MKLRKDLNSLSALSLEVPALSEDKEGLLKGGFCAVATVGHLGLQGTDIGTCNEGCKVGCNVNCVDKTCNEACNFGCNDKCVENCSEGGTDPEGGETTKAESSGAALFGFSLVF